MEVERSIATHRDFQLAALRNCSIEEIEDANGIKYLGRIRWETLSPLPSDRKAEKTTQFTRKVFLVGGWCD